LWSCARQAGLLVIRRRACNPGLWCARAQPSVCCWGDPQSKHTRWEARLEETHTKAVVRATAVVIRGFNQALQAKQTLLNSSQLFRVSRNSLVCCGNQSFITVITKALDPAQSNLGYIITIQFSKVHFILLLPFATDRQKFLMKLLFTVKISTPNPRLEDHPLSAGCDCLLNIFALFKSKVTLLLLVCLGTMPWRPALHESGLSRDSCIRPLGLHSESARFFIRES
jgi:hypothetical protein